MPRSASKYGLILAFCVAVAPIAAGTLSRQQADLFQRKVGEITKPNPPAIQPGMRRTPITEDELNSWFTYSAQPLLPSGVTAPQVSIIGEGRMRGQATVDLETIGRRRSTGSPLDPWSLLGGRVPLNITGRLHTDRGVGRFELEAADISGVPVPKLLLQELVTFYSRSEGRPQGIRLDDPFSLPANIQKIEVGKGRAVVIQ